MKVGDRTKITSHNLFAKVLKTLDILQTECELIFEPTLRDFGKIVIFDLSFSVFGLRSSVFGLRSSVFGLRSSVFSLQSSVFSLQSSVCI